MLLKIICAGLALSMLAGQARAHFVYLLPTDDGSRVEVVFSERPMADLHVSIGKILDTKLLAIDAARRASPLAWTKREHWLESQPLERPAVVVGGITEFGFVQSKHTGDKPVRLRYYPKAIVAAPGSAGEVQLGNRVPLEIVPTRRAGKLALRVLYLGRPLIDAPCAVSLAGEDKSTRSQTDGEGFIALAIDRPGRLGAWVKFVEMTRGELDGKKYDEVHHYATLTMVVAKRL